MTDNKYVILMKPNPSVMKPNPSEFSPILSFLQRRYLLPQQWELKLSLRHAIQPHLLVSYVSIGIMNLRLSVNMFITLFSK